MTFKEILARKVKHYGKTEAAFDFAVDEYDKQQSELRQEAEQLVCQSRCDHGYCDLDGNELFCGIKKKIDK